MLPEDRPTRPKDVATVETGIQDWMNTPSLAHATSSRSIGEAAYPQVQLPDYEILGPLGRGGMGVVLKARQIGLNRLVALKMLHGGLVDPADLARFRLEAEAVARLQHPHIVQIYEIGDLGNGLPFFALEYVAGGSLKAFLQNKPQPPMEAAAFVETLALAVHHAHQAGIVHRDLKPANILLAVGSSQLSVVSENPASAEQTTGNWSLATIQPKITDFGLAKRLDDPTGQTKTGDIIGTPSYMAPEQAGLTGEGVQSKTAIGPLVDVYALGAILYEMLTGRPPFLGVGAVETIWQVLMEDPVRPTLLQPKLPRDLETICLKCLAKDPHRRYASALALAEDLGRFRRQEPILARPATAWEKAVKWCKRHPTRALILALAVLVALRLGYQHWWNQSTLEEARENTRKARLMAWENLQRLAEKGDHLFAANQAEKWGGLQGADPEVLFLAAGVYARCAQAAPDQQEHYAARALTLLQQAKDRQGLSAAQGKQLREGTEWEAVRRLPAFPQFLADVP
jgi:serine/threonine protein kinase